MDTTAPRTTILIVDDDPGLRRSLQMILEHRGYHVETTEDGAQAIELVGVRPFDMILMDVRMPVLDGVHALKQIKTLRPDAMVTLMTGYAIEDLLQDALAEGAFALLDKPVSIEDVIALIERAQQVRHGALVLVIDDDPTTRTTLHRILTHQGYQVCTAGSGEEAIELTRRCAFDVLLIDLKLPALNGLETYLEIKAIHPEAVAIVFTAYPQEMHDLAQLALHSSAYACLHKPLDIDHLLDLLQEVVSLNAGRTGV